MNNSHSRVTLILSASYGSRAAKDAERGPIKSPQNEMAAEELRREYNEHGGYITVFDPHADSAEEICLDVFYDVDLHHAYMTELTVNGVGLTSRIRSTLGNGEYQKSADGFIYSRVSGAPPD
jgi:hypothetical protein